MKMFNNFEEALLNELRAVEKGEKIPEESVQKLYREFPRLEKMYLATRWRKRDRNIALVKKLKDQGVETSAVAERLDLSTSYVRRLYKRAQKLEGRGDYI